METRCLITGAKGMLGQAVLGCFSSEEGISETLGLGHKELDITNHGSVEQVAKEFSPTLIVNCAAYTNVDGAEDDQETAFRVNAMGPRVLSMVANRVGARLLHISSDYVFSGEMLEPYGEYMARCPISVYGRSKALGEQFIEEECRDFLIVRTSWLFGPGGRNFVSTILGLAKDGQELKVVDDQTGRPTYTVDLAQALLALHRSGAKGIYHFANSGHCTWFELAKKIVELNGLDVAITPVPTSAFPRPAKRPRFSVLDTGKYSLVTGLVPRPWEDALGEYLDLVSGG